MKIDEPKTPYVTDEEFKRLCDEDEEYQKAFGNDEDKIMHDENEIKKHTVKFNMNMKDIDVDVNSQEAEDDAFSDKVCQDNYQQNKSGEDINKLILI